MSLVSSQKQLMVSPEQLSSFSLIIDQSHTRKLTLLKGTRKHNDSAIMSSYNRYLDQSRPQGLPGDDFTRLRQRDGIERHFGHGGAGDAAYEAPRSTYRDAGLSRDHRSRISEVRGATRAALGSSFDFTDDSYERSQSRRRDDAYARSRGWLDDEPRDSGTIPTKYLDEFNKLWYEDDQANDAQQYQADYTREAPWRDHESMGRYKSSAERSCTPQPRTSTASSRADSGYGGSDTSSQTLKSKFSWDDDESPRRHKRLGRFLGA
ncbi:hypothetical protein ACEQ8H_005875 [Pleosporales sp. CAS-2024a]